MKTKKTELHARVISNLEDILEFASDETRESINKVITALKNENTTIQEWFMIKCDMWQNIKEHKKKKSFTSPIYIEYLLNCVHDAAYYGHSVASSDSYGLSWGEGCAHSLAKVRELYV